MSFVSYQAETAEGKILELFQHILENGDTVKVRGQDQTTPPFQYYMMRHLNENVKLVNNLAIDTETFDLQAGHGFSVGEYIVLWENSEFQQARVTAVVSNTITIEIPLATAFTTNAKVIRGSINLNIDGSGGIDFLCKPFGLGIPIDIESAIITIQSGANVPDDAKFGGIAALTNGMFIRQINGSRINLGNYRSNKDFRDRGALVTYTSKAPAGTNGTNIEFDIKDKFGIVLRIGINGDENILIRLRDNLSTLAGVTVSLLGQYTQGE